MGENEPSFSNVYDDEARAAAYAALQFPGTYFLAYRDLPAILASDVRGREALDFGCGAGRSTRFLKKLGFHATRIDISASMIQLARKLDPAGSYRWVDDGDLIWFHEDYVALFAARRRSRHGRSTCSKRPPCSKACSAAAAVTCHARRATMAPRRAMPRVPPTRLVLASPACPPAPRPPRAPQVRPTRERPG